LWVAQAGTAAKSVFASFCGFGQKEGKELHRNSAQKEMMNLNQRFTKCTTDYLRSHLKLYWKN
jgi:hypothetical protein